MASYDAFAPGFLAFPLSGPPVCVALQHFTPSGCMISMPDHRSRRNFIRLTRDLQPKSLAEKFYLEPSLEHEGLVHVKCCADSKYLVPQQLQADPTSPWFIGCTADEPEEDLEKPSCTLFDFRPINSSHVRIFHPQQKKYASVFIERGGFGGSSTSLKLVDEGEVDRALYGFNVRQLLQRKQLPKYIALKGANGKYLTVKEPYLTQKDPYLQFSSSEITDPAVVHETFTSASGMVRIRSIGSSKFWRLRENGWICADSIYAAYDHDVDAEFKVVIKEDNYIEIKNIRNGKFCKSLSDQDTEWLSASADDINDTNTREATFVFEEPIRSQEVYDVQYQAEGKKTSTNKIISRQEVLYTNTTQQIQSDTATITLSDRNESTWKLDVTAEAAIKTHLTASVPIKILKLEGGIEGHLDIKGHYTTGETKVKANKRVIEYTYPVPPMTKVVCTTFTREDVVDVPFSYKKKLILFNGEVLPPREFHDGLYRGVTSFDTDIDTHEEKVKGNH